MKRLNKKMATSAFLLTQVLCGSAFAASVTLNGTNVDYTFDDSMTGLLGSASLAGDTLYFTPTSFQAQSLNGAGFDLANNTVNIQMTAHSGSTFSNIGLTESGDYLLLGAGSTADVSGSLSVFDTAAPLVQKTASIGPTAPLTNSGAPATAWTANASTDLSAWTGAKTVNVTVSNLLLASSTAPASVGLVEKKFMGLTPTLGSVSPVPEAQSSAMLLAGLGLVAWKVGRRRSHPPHA